MRYATQTRHKATLNSLHYCERNLFVVQRQHVLLWLFSHVCCWGGEAQCDVGWFSPRRMSMLVVVIAFILYRLGEKWQIQSSHWKKWMWLKVERSNKSKEAHILYNVKNGNEWNDVMSIMETNYHGTNSDRYYHYSKRVHYIFNVESHSVNTRSFQMWDVLPFQIVALYRSYVWIVTRNV